MGSFPKMDLPGEDFINSWYPIVIALVCGLIYGIRYSTGLILVTIYPSFVWKYWLKLYPFYVLGDNMDTFHWVKYTCLNDTE